MLTFEEARGRLLAMARPGAVERVELNAAIGRTLAHAARATRDQPPADLSAMDGYAVAGAGPWRLAGESAAGGPLPRALGAGQAVRIFTGAVVPAGTDAILIQEEAARDGERVVATGAPSPGYIRARGSDFREGAELPGVGERITAGRVALAAAMGCVELLVRARPRVGVLATGDELVPASVEPGPGRIVDSAGPMLAALLGGLADVVDLGIARDRADDLARAIARARGLDLLVTVGGASVGDHDLVRPALAAAGGEVDFWRVSIRPGKPLIAGWLGDTVVLGLPGNPASAFVTAHLFVLPVLRAMLGRAVVVAPGHAARLGAALPANGGRRDHLRAWREWRGTERWVLPAARQDSGLVAVLAHSDTLIVREPGVEAAAVGDIVTVLDTDSADS